jgi:hypothetical protein
LPQLLEWRRLARQHRRVRHSGAGHDPKERLRARLLRGCQRLRDLGQDLERLRPAS